MEIILIIIIVVCRTLVCQIGREIIALIKQINRVHKNNLLLLILIVKEILHPPLKAFRIMILKIRILI